MEEWKDIKGYKGHYKINRNGDVFSYSTNKLLAKTISTPKYYVVSLWKNNKGKTIPIHRLLAEAFIPKIEGKTLVNHIDGNKLNNDLTNLEWCTCSENNKHAYDNYLKIPSEKLKQSARERALERNKNKLRSIPVVQIDTDGNLIQEYQSIREAAKASKSKEQNVSKVCRGIKLSIKNKIFMFKEDFINGRFKEQVARKG